MPNADNGVQVEKDGVLDYPLYSGQELTGIWTVTSPSTGLTVVPADGFLHYSVTRQPQGNQSVSVSLATPLQTASGCLLVFRIRANTIQGEAVIFTLPTGISLLFTPLAGTVHWVWAGNKLALSSIRADQTWHDIAIAFSPQAVSLFEDGRFIFTWQTEVGSQVSPRFDLLVLTEGVDVSFDVGDIYSVPSTFAPGVNTPWDYAFSRESWPSQDTMALKPLPGGPQFSFADGYMRLSASPQAVSASQTYWNIPQKAPAYALYTYRLRVNEAAKETYLVFPFNIFLHWFPGQKPVWAYWTNIMHILGQSSLVVGQTDFFHITFLLSPGKCQVLENGVFLFTFSGPVGANELPFHPEASPFSSHLAGSESGGQNAGPWMEIFYLDAAGSNFSLDIGGIRTLPSIKTPTQLASDLQEAALAYFPLNGSLANALGNSADLMALNGPPLYVNGPFGQAVNFSGSNLILSLPRLAVVTALSYTLSAWVEVQNYPAQSQLTGIAGNLLLSSDGHLVFRFLFNKERMYEEREYRSTAQLSKNRWHHVLVTYSYEESRLGIFLDGKMDTLAYISSSDTSISALIPASFSIGSYQASYTASPVVLDGAVSDVIFLTQHVHQPTIAVLANILPPPADEATDFFGPLLLPLFLLLLAGVTRVGVELKMLEKQPSPPPTLDELVATIATKVGVPARPGAMVSRADLNLPDTYPILLDIGGEGRLDVAGLPSGFPGAINVNAPYMKTNPRPPTVTVGGPLHGKPIPHLVELLAWETNPTYPFADQFADQIVMMNAPLTPTNVAEIARVIRNGGTIDLWIDPDYWKAALQQLAQQVNSVVEEPEEIPAFKGKVAYPRRRIVAHKKTNFTQDSLEPL